MKVGFWDVESKEDMLYKGHWACQGCGGALAFKLVLQTLGPNTVVTIPACCWTILAGPFPLSSLKIPLFHTAFETAAITAAGIKAGFTIQGKEDINVLAWAGDGGTFDIGIQALSGVAEKNMDIIYVCYDNEAYMNTGIQRSSATPYKAWTTTTPARHPQDRPKKDLVKIMAAHKIPYVATATIAYPQDLINKVRKIKKMKGTRFLHILAPCPPGWKMSSELSVKVSRLAVKTGAFVLYEIEDGKKYTLNCRKENIPIVEYLKMQGRFKHLKQEDVKGIEEMMEEYYKEIERLHVLAHGSVDNVPYASEYS